MIALRLPDVKTMTSQLFVHEAFDYFLVSEASFTTYCTFMIDGHVKSDFYSSEETEQLRDPVWTDWKTLRPQCYQLIKGSRLPLSFKIIFRLSSQNVEKMLAAASTSFTPADVDGLFLNIRYDKGALTLVTGTSLKTFTMDKSLEQEWDSMVKRLLKHNAIIFEEA